MIGMGELKSHDGLIMIRMGEKSHNKEICIMVVARGWQISKLKSRSRPTGKGNKSH